MALQNFTKVACQNEAFRVFSWQKKSCREVIYNDSTACEELFLMSNIILLCYFFVGCASSITW